MVGLSGGFNTPAFGLAMIFAIVVMHDATGVRRESGKHAISIIQMAELLNDHLYAEDEKDQSKVKVNLDLFRIYTRGFLSACDLTDREIETLHYGAKTMTLECGVRFLTDYLQGDHYFRIHRPEHNLDRCRTQFKLVAEMEAHWDEMAAIVKEEAAR